MRTVRTEKKVDTTHIAAFEAAMTEAVESGENEIVVDMADTMYISSVALRTLLKAQKQLKKEGRAMVIKNVSELVMEVFDVTGFSGILTFEE